RRPRGAPPARVDERDLGGPSERAHGPVLRRGAGRLGAAHLARRCRDPCRRRPRSRPGRDRARRARGQAAGPDRREPPARRPRRRAPGGARAVPRRPAARAGVPRRLAGRGPPRRGRPRRGPRGPAPASGRRAPGRRRPARDLVARPLLVRDRVGHEQRRDRRPREHRGGLGPIRDRARGAGAAGAARRGRGSACGRPQGPAPRRGDVDRTVLRGRRRGGGRRQRRPEHLRPPRPRGPRLDQRDRRRGVPNRSGGDRDGHLRGWRGGCRVRRVSPSAAKAAPVYLLWGEDGFLLREAALELLGDLRPVEVDGGLWQGGETGDLATPSLFGERRALLVSDAKALPDEGVRELARYLQVPDPDAPLVLVAVVGDRAKAPAALVKLVKGVGTVTEIKIPRKELPGWILKRAKAKELDLAPDGAAALVDTLGEEPGSLERALDQLA